MTVDDLLKALRGLPSDAEVFARVVSAPFDDESVELVGAAREETRLVIQVAVLDDITRELRKQDEELT